MKLKGAAIKLAVFLLVLGMTITILDWYIRKSEVEPRRVIEAEEYPKRAPFSAIRWEVAQPVVQVGDEWFKLVSLDKLPVAEIVAFSQETYRDRWQKRFEEDLVELLTRMGHPPQDAVTLVVQSLTSTELRTLEDIPMIVANRRAIRNSDRGRGRNFRRRATPRDIPIDVGERFRTNIDDQ